MNSVVRRMSKVAVIFVLRRNRNWSSVGPAVPLLAIGPSWLPALVYGTTYRSTSNLLLLFKSLKVVSRLTCLKPPSLYSFVQCLLSVWLAQTVKSLVAPAYVHSCVSHWRPGFDARSRQARLRLLPFVDGKMSSNVY